MQRYPVDKIWLELCPGSQTAKAWLHLGNFREDTEIPAVGLLTFHRDDFLVASFPYKRKATTWASGVYLDLYWCHDQVEFLRQLEAGGWSASFAGKGKYPTQTEG